MDRWIALLVALAALANAEDGIKHHGKHHHGHHHHKGAANATAKSKTSQNDSAHVTLLHKLQRVNTTVSVKEHHVAGMRKGELEVNGPLPADFADRFAKEVAKATGCKPEEVKVLKTSVIEGEQGVDEIVFEAPADILQAVEEQASDPESKLATGPLRLFLIAKDDDEADAKDGKKVAGLKTEADSKLEKEGKIEKSGDDEKDSKDDKDKDDKTDNAKKSEKDEKKDKDDKDAKDEKADEEVDARETRKEKKESSHGEEDGEDSADEEEATPVQEKGIDVDTSMPYGELEPFGREDTAQELTKGSIRESDEMVDQLERAEVAEEKRAVFRALTRLRGAAITSFDGVARSQTGNIDSYARTNHWRSTHPVRHLADEESDVNRWAFPENSD